MSLTRMDVIQTLIDRKKARTYLEIGVEWGECFFPIRARRKIAVDPCFSFSVRRRVKWTVLNPHNVRARFYRCTSDRYFARPKPPFAYDLVFIDGLHTYQQSLADVIHSLENLGPDGVIVMHDCNPPNAEAAYPLDYLLNVVHPGSPRRPGDWCGDVWKTICYLRAFRKDLRACVLDCDFGLGIIVRGNAEDSLELKEADLAKMTYQDLDKNKKELLGLKEEGLIAEFLRGL